MKETRCDSVPCVLSLFLRYEPTVTCAVTKVRQLPAAIVNFNVSHSCMMLSNQ